MTRISSTWLLADIYNIMRDALTKPYSAWKNAIQDMIAKDCHCFILRIVALRQTNDGAFESVMRRKTFSISCQSSEYCHQGCSPSRESS